MSTLVKTAEGRLVIHCITLFSNIIHARNPHFDFFFAGVSRYIHGNG